MSTFHDLTTTQLKQAIQIREQISALEAKLDAVLGGVALKASSGRTKGKRKMSAAGRASIAAAQKARWAKMKVPAKSTPATKTAKKPKRHVSAEARAKLAAAMKARWAVKRAAAE